MNRRSFLHKSLLSAGSLYAPPALFAANEQQLVMLHTNDWHSRIDPFPIDGGKMQGLGGAARRATFIEKVRATEKHVLLFDSGDIFQGTPYFNYYGGEPEMRLMSAMRYDAATLGNHDFDAGVEGFAKQLPLANFPFLNCNYDFKDSLLHGKIEPFRVFEKGAFRVGVFGVGISLEGIVPNELWQGIRLLDTLEAVRRVVVLLRHELKCNYIVCLSHLGFRYENGKQLSDVLFAKHTQGIDLILGGHTHTLMPEAHLETNLEGKPVVIHQAWWGGAAVGCINLRLGRKNQIQTQATTALLAK